MTALVLDNLRAKRVGAIAMALGLFLLAVGYLALFPQLEEQLQAFAGDLPDFYDALVGDADFTTPEGYVRTQVFALVAPLLTAGVAIATAVSVAKGERDVTMTVTFLAPVTRRMLGWSHLGAAWVVGVLGGLAVFLAVLVGGPLAGANVPFANLVAAVLTMVGFVWVASGIAWAVAAATGAPGTATGAGWGFVAVSFLANSIGELLEGARWLKSVSPWGWYGAGDAITNGFALRSLLLFVLAALLAAVGATAFERRSLQL